jgi:hypothetical protein
MSLSPSESDATDHGPEQRSAYYFHKARQNSHGISRLPPVKLRRPALECILLRSRSQS